MIADEVREASPEPAGWPITRRPISTRAPAPQPRRLSRRAIALLAGGSAIGLAAALGFALSSTGHHAPSQEAVTVEHRQSSDLLATAPKDYAAVQQKEAAALGPPPSSTARAGAADGLADPASGGAAATTSPSSEMLQASNGSGSNAKAPDRASCSRRPMTPDDRGKIASHRHRQRHRPRPAKTRQYRPASAMPRTARWHSSHPVRVRLRSTAGSSTLPRGAMWSPQAPRLPRRLLRGCPPTCPARSSRK